MDWAEEDFQGFHDDVFIDVFDTLDFSYMSDAEIAQAEELFEQGWLNPHISAEMKLAWRQAFQNFTNLELNSQQWATYRELYLNAGG